MEQKSKIANKKNKRICFKLVNRENLHTWKLPLLQYSRSVETCSKSRSVHTGYRATNRSSFVGLLTWKGRTACRACAEQEKECHEVSCNIENKSPCNSVNYAWIVTGMQCADDSFIISQKNCQHFFWISLWFFECPQEMHSNKYKHAQCLFHNLWNRLLNHLRTF